MIKEVIISIIIIISIISLDILTQNYTKESTKETRTKLSELKKEIKSGSNTVNQSVDMIFQTWEKRRSRLAYFIEHDELEKVETNLTNMRSSIEELDFVIAIQSIDEAKFILEHIEEKNAFNLENIF